MPDLPTDPDALARMLGNAGLSYDPAVPAPSSAPPAQPMGEPMGVPSLPPDVAARVARQNAVANVNGPTEIPPPAAPGALPPGSQDVFAKPPPKPTMAPGFGQGGGGAPAMRPVDTNYLDSLRAEQGPMGEAGEAEANMVKDQGIAGGRAARQIGMDEMDATRMARDRDRQTQMALQQVDDASKEAASKGIDPDHWWHSQSFGDKARLTLASVLGGFVSGYKGGPNQAIEQMNKHINDDIDAQKQKIESAKGRVGDMKGSVAEMYRRFGNLEQAEAGARILHLQQLDQEAVQYGASAKSDLVRANAAQASAALRAEIAKQAAQLTPRAGAGGGPTAKEIADRTYDIMKGESERGQSISPEEARLKAFASYGGVQNAGGLTAKPGVAGAEAVPDAPEMSFGEAVKSYLFPGSDAGLKRAQLEQHNVGVSGEIHKATGLRGESLEHAREAYASTPFTPNALIRQRNESARKFAKGGRDDGAPPPDFEEEDDGK
jgi:hypothetical protein